MKLQLDARRCTQLVERSDEYLCTGGAYCKYIHTIKVKNATRFSHYGKGVGLEENYNNETEKKCVFNSDLKVCNDRVDVDCNDIGV